MAAYGTQYLSADPAETLPKDSVMKENVGPNERSSPPPGDLESSTGKDGMNEMGHR